MTVGIPAKITRLGDDAQPVSVMCSGAQQAEAGACPRTWITRSRDEGFTLVETILGLSLFAVIVVGSAPFFISSLQTERGLGVKQTAITLASQRLEYVRSLKTSQLVTGRSQADVSALIASPGMVNLSGDVTGSGNFDAQATDSSGAALPPTQTQTVNGTVFTIRIYVNVCYLSKTTNVCTATAGTGGSTYRVSVDVSWPKPPGTTCVTGRAGQCEYVLTTLADSTVDPVFSIYGKPTITLVQDATVPPSTTLTIAHPGQVMALQVLGTNFDVNSSVLGNNGDAVGNPIINSSSSAILTYQMSSTLGTHNLTVQNPNGTSASAPFQVAISTPAVTGLSPASTSGFFLASRTFTITGSDFFATPSQLTQTVKPTITLSATRTIAGVPFIWQPTVSTITVVSRTSVTFTTTNLLTFGAGAYTGTLTLTNPDGGTVSYPFTETLT